MILPHAYYIVDRVKTESSCPVQLKMERRILGHCRDYCTTAARLQPQYRSSGEVEVDCTYFATRTRERNRIEQNGVDGGTRLDTTKRIKQDRRSSCSLCQTYQGSTVRNIEAWAVIKLLQGIKL